MDLLFYHFKETEVSLFFCPYSFKHTINNLPCAFMPTIAKSFSHE